MSHTSTRVQWEFASAVVDFTLAYITHGIAGRSVASAVVVCGLKMAHGFFVPRSAAGRRGRPHSRLASCQNTSTSGDADAGALEISLTRGVVRMGCASWRYFIGLQCSCHYFTTSGWVPDTFGIKTFPTIMKPKHLFSPTPLPPSN